MNSDRVFETPLAPRSSWAALLDREFDLLIVGGGIHGSGVARDAALRGLSTALIERGDWASGTSSRSSKLMHGGLRYLQQGAFGLVRESLGERERHLAIAPSGVTRVEFRVSAPNPWASLRMRAGIALYDVLAGGRGRGRFWRDPPSYQDARIDDARFCLSVVEDARRSGAVTQHYTRWLDWVRDGDAVVGARVSDRLSGREGSIRARVCVNAAGPWAPELAAGVSEGSPGLRLTRGSHIVLERTPPEARLFFSPEDGRVLFLIPLGDSTSLLGTTDLDETGASFEPIPTLDEVGYLRRAFVEAFPEWRGWRAVGLQCGIRPLVAGSSGDPSSISREELVVADRKSGLLHILGGKYTTYRLVAEEVVDFASTRLRGAPGERPTRTRALPVSVAPANKTGIRRAFVDEGAVGLDDIFFRRTSWGHTGRWPELLSPAATAWGAVFDRTEADIAREKQRFMTLQNRRLEPLSGWELE